MIFGGKGMIRVFSSSSIELADDAERHDADPMEFLVVVFLPDFIDAVSEELLEKILTWCNCLLLLLLLLLLAEVMFICVD